MTEMIERAARAICKAEGHDPDFDYKIGGSGDLRWKLYLGQALAAIEAIENDELIEALKSIQAHCVVPEGSKSNRLRFLGKIAGDALSKWEQEK